MMKFVMAFLLMCGCALAQDMDSCPMHKEHMAAQHQADVQKRGDDGMGFSHERTTHHFRLYADGGAVEVTANDSKDSANVQAIRTHLTHIAGMFSSGNFSIPMFIHDRVPPGVEIMKKQQAAISYKFEEMTSGARVRIRTTNPEAVKALHDFLRFQIEDHETGDPNEVSIP